jgi:hypothetical protein
MAALRSNDVEEYMRLVQGARNSKIEALLSQVGADQGSAFGGLHGSGAAQHPHGAHSRCFAMCVRLLILWGAGPHLPPQTDSCLRQLSARLGSAGAGVALQDAAAAGGSPSQSGSPQAAAGGGIAALEQSHEAWNQLARAFLAEVHEQPKLLTGDAAGDTISVGSLSRVVPPALTTLALLMGCLCLACTPSLSLLRRRRAA